MTGTSGDVMAIPLHAPAHAPSTSTTLPPGAMITHTHNTMTNHPHGTTTTLPLSTPSGFTALALASLLCSAHAAHRQYNGRTLHYRIPPPSPISSHCRSHFTIIYYHPLNVSTPTNTHMFLTVTLHPPYYPFSLHISPYRPPPSCQNHPHLAWTQPPL